MHKDRDCRDSAVAWHLINCFLDLLKYITRHLVREREIERKNKNVIVKKNIINNKRKESSIKIMTSVTIYFLNIFYVINI